jgi:prepilin-type N-terminal cleavage/methylation domain-containing protein
MLKKILGKGNKGFTIIEVMIVLAIAGLILVVVLVAVPQLQRNQRDSARRDVLARLSTELLAYASNNNGVMPFADSGNGSIADFTTKYITGKVDAKNPSTGNPYVFGYAATGADAVAPTVDQVLVHRGATCNGESASGTTSTVTARSFAIRLQLEGGTTFYCVDNM